MRDVQRVVIVDPSDMNRTTLANMLLGLESEGIWLDADCPRYDFFPEVVVQSNPDVAIIALDVVALYGLCAYGSRENITSV